MRIHKEKKIIEALEASKHHIHMFTDVKSPSETFVHMHVFPPQSKILSLQQEIKACDEQRERELKELEVSLMVCWSHIIYYSNVFIDKTLYILKCLQLNCICNYNCTINRNYFELLYCAAAGTSHKRNLDLSCFLATDFLVQSLNLNEVNSYGGFSLIKRKGFDITYLLHRVSSAQ